MHAKDLQIFPNLHPAFAAVAVAAALWQLWALDRECRKYICPLCG